MHCQIYLQNEKLVVRLINDIQRVDVRVNISESGDALVCGLCLTCRRAKSFQATAHPLNLSAQLRRFVGGSRDQAFDGAD